MFKPITRAVLFPVLLALVLCSILLSAHAQLRGAPGVLGEPAGAGEAPAAFIGTAAALLGDPTPDLVIGPGSGAAVARVLSGADGAELASGFPFGPGFTGGVRVAAGDINGDGVDDIVTAMGPGGSLVRIFSGVDAALIAEGYPFGPGFGGGVFVAVGDVNGDGRADVSVGAGSGGGVVRAYSGVDLSVLIDATPFGAGYTGGVHVAAGDVTGDGHADVIVGQAAGGLAAIVDGATTTTLVSGAPFGGGFAGGVFVAAGDVNGDGRADVIVSPGSGNGPVRVYDIASLQELASFVPYDASFAGGVRVAAADFDGDGLAEIVTAPGPGGAPLVRLYRGGTFAPFASLFVYPPAFAGGVFVAAPATSGLRFTSANAAAFTRGQFGTFAVQTVGGGSAVTLAVAGPLPTGVTFMDLGNGTATLDGTPTSAGGVFPLTFTATAGTAVVTQDFTLTVQEAPAITSVNAVTFTLNQPGSFTVTATGLPTPGLTRTGTLPSGVTFTDNGNGTGTLAGTPTEAGTFASLQFTASNGVGAPAVQSFTLRVLTTLPPTLDPIPDPPPIAEDAAQQTVGLSGITAGAGESQPLDVTAISSNPGLIPHPAVTYTSPGTTGSLGYTPAADASGTAIVTVTVTDGGEDGNLATADDNGTVSRAFTVAVTAVNDPPTLAAIADPSPVAEDSGPHPVALSGISAGGGETQILQVTASSDTPGVVPHPPVTYTSPNPTGSLAFTPVPDASGTATITVTVTDGGLDNDLGTAGDNAAVTRTFTVVVTAVNDPPTLDPIADPAAIAEDIGSPQIVALAGISAGGGESEALAVAAQSSNTALVPHPDVTYTSPATTGSLAYTPLPDAFGTAMITVRVTDAGLNVVERTFTVVVNAVNDAPTLDAIADPAPIAEDSGLQTVNLGGITAGGGEAQPLQVTATSDNTALIPHPTVSYVSPSTTGSLTYTPVADASGSALVTVTVTDGGLDNDLGTAGDNGSVTRTFTVVVTATFDPPTFDAIPDVTIQEDAGAQIVNVTGISAGPGETQPLQLTAASSNTALVPHPVVTYTSPNASGSLQYTPVANASGTADITVTVTDGGLDNDLGTPGDNQSAARIFTVTVTAVNDAPSFVGGANQTVNEDAGAQTVAGWATTISAGPGEGGQTVTFEIAGNNNPGLFSAAPAVAPNGTLTYTPAADQNGTAEILVRARDDGGTANGGADTSPSHALQITVNAVNDAPVAQAKGYAAQANMKITGLSGLLTGVTDADAGVNGCTPSFSVSGVSATTPAGGTISNLNAAAGSFDFEPPPGVTGNVTFTYTVQDDGCPGSATSAPALVTVSVAGPVIWFVDSTAPAGGNGTWTGTNAKAFQTLAQAAAVDASDHRIFVLNNSGSPINYAGGVTLNTGEWLVGQGVVGASFDSVMGIAPPLGTVVRPAIGGVRPTFGGTVQMNTQSASNVVKLLGFNLSTGASTGLTNGGTTINGVTVDLGSLTTTTGTAVSVTGTNNGTIAPNALKFISVSANGAGNGIDLRNAVGSFEVTGDGTNTSVGGNASGGTIANSAGADGATTGNAVYLQNVQNVTLRRMTINGTNQNHGIRGVGVNGLTLEYSTVGGSNGTSTALDEGSVNFDNLTGSAAITSSVIEGGLEDNLNVVNTSGTLNRLTITGSTFGFNNTVNGNNNVLIEAQNAGTTLNFTIQSSTIKGARADWINASANSGSSMDAIIGGSTGALGNLFDNLGANAHAGAAPGGNRVVLGSIGTMTLDIQNNTLRGGKGGALFVRSSGTAAGATGTATGHVRNNTIGVQAIANSGSSEGSAISAFGDGGSDMTLAITNNQVFQYNNHGISLTFGDELNDGSVFNITVTGNTVSTPGTINTDFNAIHLNNGTVAATDNFTSCVDIGGAGVGNSVAGGGKGTIPPNNADIRVRQRQSTIVRLPGYGGATNDDAAVVIYLTGRNTLLTAAASNSVPTGGGFVGGGACVVPQ